jgi:hypothetical protein
MNYRNPVTVARVRTADGDGQTNPSRSALVAR